LLQKYSIKRTSRGLTRLGTRLTDHRQAELVSFPDQFRLILATVEEEGRSGELSNQTEVLLCNCSVPISNSESFMGTHSTVIKALICSILRKQFIIHPFPALFLNKNSATACSSVWVQIHAILILAQ